MLSCVFSLRSDMKMNIELARATDVNEIEALYGAVVDD